MNDELGQLRSARPDVQPPSPRLVQSERKRLMTYIRTQDRSVALGTATGPRRRWSVPLAAVAVVVTAAAAWAVAFRGGNLETPPFSGESWELIVGEEPNGDGTYKVCHKFQPVGEAHTDGNGLGGAGCATSPDDSGAESVIVDVVAAVDTPSGIVVLVDLTEKPVATVVVTPDAGPAIEVEPFRMPQSGKQFAAVEIPGTPASATVEALAEDGTVLESRTVTDLKVT